jgi:hypothetical protein
MTEEKLETIEEAIESKILDRFSFENLDEAAYFRICMWVSKELEDEYDILSPFKLVFDDKHFNPCLMILNGDQIEEQEIT